MAEINYNKLDEDDKRTILTLQVMLNRCLDSSTTRPSLVLEHIQNAVIYFRRKYYDTSYAAHKE
jgi:hypothetical protein